MNVIGKTHDAVRAGGRSSPLRHRGSRDERVELPVVAEAERRTTQELILALLRVEPSLTRMAL